MSSKKDRPRLDPPDFDILQAIVMDIENYRKSDKPNLSYLASALDIYIENLSSGPALLRQDLRNRWWVLEETNAVDLDEKSSVSLEKYQDLATAALEGILQAVRSEISDAHDPS